ncbi:HET-domain-containing protein [Aspergillus sclerotioniger CBS 115572]|uniref:HET-domain-containing protein n=1 Tax=Aspergillus sclerotioniger CBS 115572 TaxID=1450535 RepID=A0A317W7A1_9EURO|nr:HET-domain-containing protein [Aspergillus sclerotioniger CBS 115572]PWY80888.1 HET-domain-containing protein [Aspergillus sclerotioniger CBS 115572]
MDAYDYDPLNLEGPSARLLLLYGGEWFDKLECTLMQAWFDGNEALSYEALSYTWGDGEKPNRIKIDGKWLPVTTNLFDALTHLRYPTEPRILWVDAVCINQNDTRERGHQVHQMRNIYSRAERVIFWLGPGTSETNAILYSLYELEQESLHHGSSRNWKLTDERWRDLWSYLMRRRHPDLLEMQKTGMKLLLDRPWFRRVWIVQEVANARSALVCCGSRSVSALFFALGPLLTEVEPMPHCQAILDLMPGPARNHSWWSRRQDLHTLLCKSRHSEAKDPKDMIYGLLSIASDMQSTNEIQVDYNKSEAQVVAVAFSFFYHDLFPNHFSGMSQFVANLDILDARCLLTFVQSFNFNSDLGLLEERKVRAMIANDISFSAARNWCPEEALSRLFEEHASGISMTRGLVRILTYHSNNSSKCRTKAPTLPNERFSIAAECSKRHREMIINCLIQHYPDCFIITDHNCGEEILECILKQCPKQTTIPDPEVVMLLARFFSAGLMSLFLDKYGDDIAIFSVILEQAAGNTKDGGKMVELLLRRQSDEIMISEDVVIAVANNRYQGKVIMEVLLEQRSNKVEITWPILKTVMDNDKDGLHILKLLLEKRRSDTLIFEHFMRDCRTRTPIGQAVFELLDYQSHTS